MELVTLALALTILLFCAIVASLIAMHKGRSGLRWLFLGFVLGPFALAVALLPPSLTKKCPKCANYVRIEAQICRFCGYGFRPSSNKNRDSFRIEEAKNIETIIKKTDDFGADKTIIRRMDDFETDKTIIRRIDDFETDKTIIRRIDDFKPVKTILKRISEKLRKKRITKGRDRKGQR